MRLWPWGKTGREAKASTWQVFRDLFVDPVKSGAVVNEKTALQVSTVLACARVIAEGVAQVPLKVHQKQGSTQREADEHPVYTLLGKRPNDWQTSFEFREQLALHLVLCGNAFAFKNLGSKGQLLELLPFTPGAVTVTQRDDRTLQYVVRLADGRDQAVPAANMWHLRGPSWDGWRGLDAVRLARESLGLAMALEEHSARMFSNGAKVAGVLSTPNTLTPDQIEKLRQSWQETQGGSANAYKTAILFGGLEWKPMAMQSDQAQQIEQRRFQVEEICRAMRVMPIMVGAADKTATYASAEQMFLAHVMHTLMPWYRRIEDSIDVNLLGIAAVREGYYAKFNANGLMRGSAQARGEYYTRLYNIGAINPNEIRALEEMNPYDAGDQYRVPLNMVDPADPAGDPGAAGAGND